MPLVSVATISWVVSEALSSKISAVVLFPENISSACKIVYHNMTVSAKMSPKSNFSWISCFVQMYLRVQTLKK